MDVKVEVAIDVVEAANQSQMQFNLGTDFVAQARADNAIEKIAQAGADRATGEVTGGINEAGRSIRWQHAPSTTDDEMEANIKVGIFVRESAASRIPATIRLVAVRTPSRCARMMPALTSRE
jgi:hypothetical protein